MKRATKTNVQQAAKQPAKRSPRSLPQPVAANTAAPHKHARRDLPPIERSSDSDYPLVYRERNKHARNEQRCRESPLVAAPENMIAVVFEDGGRLVTLRRNVHELDVSALSEAGTETDRKFWGTR